MLTIKELSIPGYKRVIEAIDPEVNLHGFIAIHDSSLGPALGGMRIYPYASSQDALEDVLRLAKCMTYKSASIELGLGGGKSVIMGDPKNKSPSLLEAFAAAIDYLKGEYIAAEDVGTSPEDMMVVRKKTPYVVALPIQTSSGDPSRFTAWGIYRGMQAIAQTLWKTDSLRGKKILIQGLGKVGSKLASHLFWHGADLLYSDLNQDLLNDHLMRFGGKVIPPQEIYRTECDIFSPCAMGGGINDNTISQLKCKAIAGSANNQLREDKHGIALMQKGILYAPDYVINAGGILNASTEFEPAGYDPRIARDKVDRIYERLLMIFDRSYKEKKPTSQIADEIAEHNLKHEIGKRKHKISFK